jgi:hypothetical protein
MQTNTEARLVRRFTELTVRVLDGTDWTRAQTLLNSNTLSLEDRQRLVQIVIDRNGFDLIQFLGGAHAQAPATPVFKGWKEFKKTTGKSLRGMWEFLSGIILLVSMLCKGLVKLVCDKMIRPCVKSVCYIIRKCSGLLIGIFCLGLGFCWWVITSGITFVLATLYTCFGHISRLFAGDLSTLFAQAPVVDQCMANHTAAGNHTREPTAAPDCCKNVPEFDFIKYWDANPAARQMIISQVLKDIKPVKSVLRNVLSDRIAREQLAQKRLIGQLQTEMEANRASMTNQGAWLDTVILFFSVYTVAKTVSAGRNMFLNTPGGQTLRAATFATQAQNAGRKALQTAAGSSVTLKDVASWLTWDSVKATVFAASKHTSTISAVSATGATLFKNIILNGSNVFVHA